MSRLKVILCLLAACSGATITHAAAPTQVDDTFLVEGARNMGMGSVNLYYLAADGTYLLLSSASYGGSGLLPAYQRSQEGNFTYAVSPGNGNEATLTLSGQGSLTLEFGTGLTGAVSGATATSFSFYQASQNDFLANVSNRVVLHPSESAVTGFVIQGNSSRLVLVRAVGPTLSEFGVTPVSPNPQFSLFAGVGSNQIASGEPWSSATKFDATAMGWIFEKAGAFQLLRPSSDVAYFGILGPGTYTAQAFDSTVGPSVGSALVEVYILPYTTDPGATAAF